MAWKTIISKSCIKAHWFQGHITEYILPLISKVSTLWTAELLPQASCFKFLLSLGPWGFVPLRISSSVCLWMPAASLWDHSPKTEELLSAHVHCWHPAPLRLSRSLVGLVLFLISNQSLTGSLVTLLSTMYNMAHNSPPIFFKTELWEKLYFPLLKTRRWGGAVLAKRESLMIYLWLSTIRIQHYPFVAGWPLPCKCGYRVFFLSLWSFDNRSPCGIAVIKQLLVVYEDQE